MESSSLNGSNGTKGGGKVYFDHSPRSVALVAMGPSITAFLTDTLTQEFSLEFADEIWAINMASNAVYCDVVFWMDDLIAQHEFRPGLFDVLNKRGKPVITTDRRPEIVLNSYDYPLDPIAAIGFEAFGKPYLNNGVAMAMAYAVHKGVKKLKLYGADFTYPNRTYAERGRGCLESWVMVAMQRGMEISLAGNSSLFDAYHDSGIYGYREQPELTRPDGQRFKYFKGPAPAADQYVAENSAGLWGQ